jgi:hypothetical protein
MVIQSTVDANKALVRETLQRIFNEHNPDLASEYFTPEAKWHGGILGTVEGIENVTAALRGSIVAFPDLHATDRTSSRRETRSSFASSSRGRTRGISSASRRSPVDVDKAHAAFEDGMPKLTLPKSESAKPRSPHAALRHHAR